MDTKHCTKPSPPITRRRLRGLTLVESAVVIAVMAILAAAAAPSLSAFIDDRRLDGAATLLAADIQLARSEAAARNRAIRLSVRSDGDATCWIVHTGSAAQCRCGTEGEAAVCNTGAVALRSARLGTADRMRVEANVGSIVFDPLHGTASPTGTLRIADSRGRAVQHVVNVMGRARSCSPGAAVSGWRAC